jgi:ABC-type branched-subunit amino acid transport system ATPase component
MLKVENLESGYGKAMILNKLSVEILEGELVSVIGPNGSGKSTLLKTIMGIVKVSSGKITFKNLDITNYNTSELAKFGLGYVPQLENVFPNLTIIENLEMGALINKDKEHIKHHLERVNRLFPILNERKKEKAKKLSGGERQMLALGRALMSDPDLLLLDEPTAALSPVLVTEILEIVKKITHEEKIPVLLVEQNAKKSLAICDRAYLLTTGQVFKHGKGSEFLTDKSISEAFLGA